MRALPALSDRTVIAALERAGFEVVRTKGSHRFLRHRDDPTRQTVGPFIGAISRPERFALYCAKPVSPRPSSSIFSKQFRRYFVGAVRGPSVMSLPMD
jgi:predicted RNA binding protein YcfA (HicA-like mRNA interferase family)